MAPSVFVLPSRWWVLLIQPQMWPSPFQSLLAALRGSLRTSTAPKNPLLVCIFWPGWLIPCFESFEYKVHSFTTWNLCPMFARERTISLSQAKQRRSAAEKSPEDLTRFFSPFANMLQHVKSNDPKPDIWTLCAGWQRSDSWSNSGPLDNSLKSEISLPFLELSDY